MKIKNILTIFSSSIGAPFIICFIVLLLAAAINSGAENTIDNNYLASAAFVVLTIGIALEIIHLFLKNIRSDKRRSIKNESS